MTGTAWKVAATGDYNGDGRADVLWRNESTGANALWLSASSTNLQAVAGSSVAWEIKP